MDWFKEFRGKITGNHRFSPKIWGLKLQKLPKQTNPSWPSLPSGKHTKSYWKWTSRNSEFTHFHSMVIFPSVFCKRLPKGKPPFSYGFPMLFSLKPPFSYGIYPIDPVNSLPFGLWFTRPGTSSNSDPSHLGSQVLIQQGLQLFVLLLHGHRGVDALAATLQQLLRTKTTY